MLNLNTSVIGYIYMINIYTIYRIYIGYVHIYIQLYILLFTTVILDVLFIYALNINSLQKLFVLTSHKTVARTPTHFTFYWL